MSVEVSKYSLFQNGATWLRADFHLHTCSDKEFRYSGNKFDEEFIAKLKEKQVNIGVISNHNKFNLDEFKPLYKRALKEEIYLLPAVELSINDGSNGIHCIIVFDYERWIINNDDFVNKFLDSAFEKTPNREDSNSRCKYNLVGLFDKLNEHRSDHRDSFILMAHIEQNNGFFKELDGGKILELGKTDSYYENVLGFQKVRTFDDIKKLEQWLKKLPAFVEGSDCKVLEEVGKAPTQNKKEKLSYVKIGDFTFEAIKYSLIDYKSRLRNCLPQIENSFIKSISFKGGKLDAVTINFSSNMNNLIGIRGSGKSSILETIRYVLDISLNRKSRDKDYKENLVYNLIGSGGKVTLEVVTKEQQTYSIEKIFGEKSDIRFDGKLIPSLKINDNIIKRLYFGQKDLSDTEEGFNEEFLMKFMGNKVLNIKDKIHKISDEIKTVVNSQKSIERSLSKKIEVVSEISTLDQKQKLYKKHNVEDKLKKQIQMNKDEDFILEVLKFQKSVIKDLKELRNEYSGEFKGLLNYSSMENGKLINDVKIELKKFETSFERINLILEELKQSEDKTKNWQKSLSNVINSLKDEFSDIKRQLNQKDINTDDYLTNSNRINLLSSQLKEIEKLEEKDKKQKNQLQLRLNELRNYWYEEYKILEEEVRIINSKNLSISIDIGFKEDKTSYENFLVDFFKGSGISRSIIKKLTEKYKDNIQLFYDIENKDSDLYKIVIINNQLINFLNYINENKADFLLYRVPDKFDLKYKGKILQEHSLGQRASALIIFILTIGENDLIIIDQPEDDLDNQSIYNDVIKELCELKNKTQFIFATHNPNIPVLGDSEQVVSCKYLGNKIDLIVNSIDNEYIQNEIVNIMEGGEEAFQKRKEIYKLWKN